MRRQSLAVLGTILCVACGGAAERRSEPDGRARAVDHTAEAGDTTAQDPNLRTPGTASHTDDDTIRAAAGAMRQRPGSPGDTSAQGIVRAVGPVPTAQLVVRSTTGDAVMQVGIRGPLAEELGALVGAEVRVWGEAVANQPPPPLRAIDVSGYDIVSVSGRKPYVGILSQHDNGLWLNAETVMRLVNVPEELVAGEGAKVWIVGSVDGDLLTVQSYGVIRRP